MKFLNSAGLGSMPMYGMASADNPCIIPYTLFNFSNFGWFSRRRKRMYSEFSFKFSLLEKFPCS